MRLIDANANRAREGLRVLEDYARFLLNSKDLCESLKGLRHDLTDALRDTVAAAIFHRDTPHDVGTTVTTAAESKREDVAAVVTAAGKRLGEALRAIEEYLKTSSPAAAARVESIRYRFYDIEQKLARTLPRRRQQLADVRLYVLITESICKTDWYATAEAAIRGGADCLQLREKDLPAGELLHRARRMVELCRRHGVLSIINDRPDVALLAEADGVHVGQGDLPATEARKIVGPDLLVGVSTHAIEQARAAVADGADYIGVGPVFPSTTKPRHFNAGLEYARAVAAEITIPSVAIAGITADNVAEVVKTGVKAVAVTAAVVGCDDVEAAARQLKGRLPPA